MRLLGGQLVVRPRVKLMVVRLLVGGPVGVGGVGVRVCIHPHSMPVAAMLCALPAHIIIIMSTAMDPTSPSALLRHLPHLCPCSSSPLRHTTTPTSSPHMRTTLPALCMTAAERKVPRLHLIPAPLLTPFTAHPRLRLPPGHSWSARGRCMRLLLLLMLPCRGSGLLALPLGL